MFLTQQHNGPLTTDTELPPAPGKRSFLKHPTARLGCRLACVSLPWWQAQLTVNYDKPHAVILTVLGAEVQCSSRGVKSQCEQGWSLSPHSHCQLHSCVNLSLPLMRTP